MSAGPAPAEPAPVSAAAPATSEDEVTARVLELVAQETGYPTDLLDPDLDLEADLGIDTVKQAEVFAAIREHYAIERDEALKLRDYPTLRSVVRFVTERSPQPAAADGEPGPPTPAPAEAAPASAAPAAPALAEPAPAEAAPASAGAGRHPRRPSPRR